MPTEKVTNEVVIAIKSMAFSLGIVGVMAVLVLFAEIPWGWLVFLGFCAIGALSNDSMRDISK